MAYSDFAPHRRSRRRRNVAILVVLLVVIGVLVLAVRYRTERRETIDYLTVADEVAADHAAMSEQLGALLQGLGGEQRPALELRLEKMVTDARMLAVTLDDQVVPRPVAEVSGLLTVATSSWADGISAFHTAILDILDPEESDGVGDTALRDAFDLIRLGDRAYAQARSAVAELDPELTSGDLPEVTYTEGTYGPLYDATVVADRLRRLGTLAEVVDVKVVMKTDPEPVSDNGSGIWTIPASDTLSLQVTVSNTGNVVAENITVLVELQRVASAEEFAPLSKLIPAIAPGDSEISVFENIPAEPGAVYSLTATASVLDVDDPTDDNTDTLVFERNEQ
jgi:hypothetical protein